MEKTITTGALLAAALHSAEKPRTCYWYSHDQHMAVVNQGLHADTGLIRVRGQLKLYTARTTVPAGGSCKLPSDADYWHDFRLVAREPGDKVEAVEAQPRVVK
jgi:hypothetical protein